VGRRVLVKWILCKYSFQAWRRKNNLKLSQKPR
jgi:hypothetical protein